MNNLTPLEQEVIQKLLAGDDGILSILRDQFEAAVLAKREMTGAGFYTTFSLSRKTRIVPNCRSLKFGDVTATIPELEFGAGFMLFVQDGVLHMLEGYSYEEPWPRVISRFDVSYVSGEKRDMEHLSAILHGTTK